MSFYQNSRESEMASFAATGKPDVYNRDHRAFFNLPGNYPETSSLPSPLTSRVDRSSAYYGSQDYPSTSRDTRGEPWPVDNSNSSGWYGRRYTPPPVPTPAPSHYQATHYSYSPPPPAPAPPAVYHNQSLPAVYRDERRTWHSPPGERPFEPSPGWGHTREPSTARLTTILNPTPSNSVVDDRRWRDTPETLHTREYVHSYPSNYPPYDYAPSYYESRPPYSPPTQQYYDERVQPHFSPNYRPPPRNNRPSAMGNYKRQRQPSQGQFRHLDDSFSEPRRPTSSPNHSAEHARSASIYSQSISRLGNSPITLQVKTVDGSDSESSGGDSEEKSSRFNSPVHSLRPTNQNGIIPSQPKPPSTRRFSPVHHDSSSHEIVTRDARDQSTPSTLQIKSPLAPPDAPTGRQSVMSVSNLIAPTPTKIPTPLSVIQKDLMAPIPSEEDPRPSPPLINVHPNLHDAVPPSVPSANDRDLTLDVEIAGGRTKLDSPKEIVSPSPEGLPELVTNTNIEVGSGQELPINMQISYPDADVNTPPPGGDEEAPLSKSMDDRATIPDPERVQKDVPTIVRPQPSWINRPKPDEKMIFDTLRKVILARRNFSSQTREQRVNPILMANLAIADPTPLKRQTSPGAVVEEVMEKLFASGVEEQQANVRAALATNFAAQNEHLAEKTQKLRDEYLALHKQWVRHCSKLDSHLKANDMHEATSVSSRTTRRSAATLGDAVRSDLEMEQIIATLGNEDLTDPNHLAVRNVANVPDMISVERGRLEYLFDDTNGLVDDPASFYDPRSGFHDWTPEEEAIFYDKYAEYPKQFGIIASYLLNKSAAQCVLYYYLHKKKLIDFRQAANSGLNKRKGTRKGRKRKGNALLADIEQTDSQRPAGRGRRRGGGRGRGGGIQPVEVESDRPKRRRTAAIAAGPKIVMAKEMEMEDSASVSLDQDTDQSRDVSNISKKPGRRGRKSKNATDSPAEASPAPGEPKFIDVNETLGRRKVTASTSHWSESDIDDFLKLLARHGKDFKRISASLPSKTVAQVSNYYKNHKKEMGLEKIALAAQARSASTDTESREASNSHQFVEVTPPEASQSQTPTEDSQAELTTKDKALPSSERTWSGEEYPFPPHPQAIRMHQPALGQQPYVIQPGAFHAANSASRMILHTHSPIPYPMPVVVAAGHPGPIGSSAPHVNAQATSHSPQGQADTEPQAPFGQQGGGDARYSSFRTQLPPGTVFINDKRMPVPIQPAPGHAIPLRPDGYPFFPMHPGTAIHYRPIPSPDQLAHARLTSAAAQQNGVLPSDAPRPAQTSPPTSTRVLNSVDGRRLLYMSHLENQQTK